MESVVLDVIKECSVPYGRYNIDGPCSGECFRETKLIPYLDKYENIIIDISGTQLGYPSSWLEECFGGLIRNKYMNKAEFIRRVSFIGNNSWVDEILEYVDCASKTN